MENLSSAERLKNTIQRLEVEQNVNGRLLREQLYLTYESYKPVNLLKSTLVDITSSPNLIDNIIGTAVGLATGYLSRIVVVGASGSLVKKLFGTFLQLGVTNSVAEHPDTIKSIGKYLYQHIFRKKDKALPPA